MADSYHFFMALDPPTATQQEHQVRIVRDRKSGKCVPKFFPSHAWSEAEATLRAYLERHRPQSKLDRSRAVVLDTTWCFPAGDNHIDGEPHTEKPDTDNLEKGLKDIMTKLGWWEDDCQVFDSHTTKIYSSVPGIRIDIEEVPTCR